MRTAIIKKPYNAGFQVSQNRDVIVGINGRAITKKELLGAKVLAKIFLSLYFGEKMIVA